MMVFSCTEAQNTFSQKNYTPTEMLKTWNFWSLYITFFCNGMGITYMAGYWKVTEDWEEWEEWGRGR